METACSVPWLPRSGADCDDPWLAAARQGEEWALERLYQTYHNQVYRLCHRLLGRTEDAKDATQSTFVQAFRQLHRFRGESALKTWIYRIAVNEAVSLLRKRRDGVELPEEGPTGGDEPRVILEQIAVQSALGRMNPQHRTVLVLRFWEGLSCDEIAAVMRISLPAAKMRLYRAREEFRKCYEGL